MRLMKQMQLQESRQQETRLVPQVQEPFQP